MTNTILVEGKGNTTAACCPGLHKNSEPYVLLQITNEEVCLPIRLGPTEAVALGQALSQAGFFINPMAAQYLDAQTAIEENLG